MKAEESNKLIYHLYRQELKTKENIDPWMNIFFDLFINDEEFHSMLRWMVTACISFTKAL